MEKSGVGGNKPTARATGCLDYGFSHYGKHSVKDDGIGSSDAVASQFRCTKAL